MVSGIGGVGGINPLNNFKDLPYPTPTPSNNYHSAAQLVTLLNQIKTSLTNNDSTRAEEGFGIAIDAAGGTSGLSIGVTTNPPGLPQIDFSIYYNGISLTQIDPLIKSLTSNMSTLKTQYGPIQPIDNSDMDINMQTLYSLSNSAATAIGPSGFDQGGGPYTDAIAACMTGILNQNNTNGLNLLNPAQLSSMQGILQTQGNTQTDIYNFANAVNAIVY